MTKKTNKNPRLGNNPLDWIGKNPATKTETNPEKKKLGEGKEKKPKKDTKRETFIIQSSLSEKIKDFAYWERKKQKDVLNDILEEFFKGKNVKSRPEK